MKVLNASHRVLNIMMDRGDMMTVAPGKLSEVFVASKNCIIACINSGKPTEIGIILGGTYEQGIAASITGGQPYYYLSEDEAKAKLLDPTIKYGQSMQNIQVDNMREDINRLNAKVTELEDAVESRDRMIDTYKEEIQSLKSDATTNLRVKQLMDESAQQKAEITRLSSELDGASSTIDSLRVQLGTVTAERDSYQSNVANLTHTVEELRSAAVDPEEVEKLRAEVETLRASEDKLKKGLSESVDKIESMRTTFNEVCDKFKIYYQDGQWYQVLAETVE